MTKHTYTEDEEHIRQRRPNKIPTFWAGDIWLETDVKSEKYK